MLAKNKASSTKEGSWLGSSLLARTRDIRTTMILVMARAAARGSGPSRAGGPRGAPPSRGVRRSIGLAERSSA